jgi:hypothetical protein
MQNEGPVTLTRDVEASVVPVGTKVALKKAEQTHIAPWTEETRIPALQGRKMIAQGGALGERDPVVISPVRATQNHRWTCSGRFTQSVAPLQGFALGYFISPRRG